MCPEVLQNFEYRALANAIYELQWHTFLLEEFNINFQHPVILYCDNKYTLHIASNPVFHENKTHRD